MPTLDSTPPAIATPSQESWEQFSPVQRWSFLAILFLVATASYVDRAILPVLLEPLRIEFGLSDSMLGALSGAPFAICYGLATIPFARLSDRGNRKLWLILAFVIWTGATILCGVATSLTLLFIARMGVGVGEGGAIPISHALVADYFPPVARGRAFSILTSASTVGSVAALVIGGWLAKEFGWRYAFLAMGLGSLPIGLLAALVLGNPRRAIRSASAAVPFKRDIAALLRKPSFVFLVGGFTLYSVFVYGPAMFMPVYLVRYMGTDLAVAGQAVAAATVVGSVLGYIMGGLFSDRLFNRDSRWLVWCPAVGFLLAMPAAFAAYTAVGLMPFLFWSGAMLAVLTSVVPAIFAAVQHVCGPTRRATASAVIMAAINIVGMTLGPFLTGAMSDGLRHSFGQAGLRYASIGMIAFLLPAAVLMALASRNLRSDAE